MTLFELLHLLRKHLVFIIVLPIVTAAITAGASLLLPDEYTTSTSLYVLSRKEEDLQEDTTAGEFSLGQMLTSDVTTIINSARVKSETAAALGLGGLGGYKISVANSGSRVITVTVTGTDPKGVTDVANTLARTASKVAVEVMQIDSVNVIDVASVPTGRSGPPRTLYTLVGGMAGLFLAVAILVIADAADTRVRSGSDVEELIGLPVVGHFPVVERA